MLLQIHLGLSLIGIVAGIIALRGMLSGELLTVATAIFLATTTVTSITGFALPPFGFDPPRAVAILSLSVLALASAGLYIFNLLGAWRWIYVLAAITALFLNCFVAVVQSFQKVPFLSALAPTQSEPPFFAAQIVLLAIFVTCAFLAVRRFDPPDI
jgi:hypothetical protein